MLGTLVLDKHAKEAERGVELGISSVAAVTVRHCYKESRLAMGARRGKCNSHCCSCHYSCYKVSTKRIDSALYRAVRCLG